MIPNLLKKCSIPDTLPHELEVFIASNSAEKSQAEFLQLAFIFMAHRWRGSRLNLLFKAPRLFISDFDKLFYLKGYQHCTSLNYLLRGLLVRSGYFKESDIRLKYSNSWFLMPHQYLQVKLETGEFISLDPWAYQFGIDFGDYARGFNSLHFYPIR